MYFWHSSILEAYHYAAGCANITLPILVENSVKMHFFAILPLQYEIKEYCCVWWLSRSEPLLPAIDFSKAFSMAEQCIRT